MRLQKYGTGFKRIKDWISAYQDMTLRIEEIPGALRTTIFSKVGEKVGERVGEKVGEKLTVNQERIIKNIKNNKHISAKQLSQLIGISDRKIEENIKKLKEKNILKRVGPAKGGYWKILDHA